MGIRLSYHANDSVFLSDMNLINLSFHGHYHGATIRPLDARSINLSFREKNFLVFELQLMPWYHREGHFTYDFRKNPLGGFHHTCLLAHCQEFFGPGVFWPIFGGQKTPDKLHVMKPQKMSGVFWPRSLLAQKSFGPVYIVQHDSQLEHATRHVALGR